MRIHVIQTGTVAIKRVQQQGKESGNPLLNMMLDPNWTEPLPIYAFVIEHPEGLIVVDTGETARAAEPGYFPWWHPYYRFGVREWVQPEEEIGPQMRAMGFDPGDVRWVLLTHLHTDHAGGLSHFPKAEGVRWDCCAAIHRTAGRTGSAQGPSTWGQNPPGLFPAAIRSPKPGTCTWYRHPDIPPGTYL
jgi:glyoxylase-like metal-dependent hydrolase (beta-lactamase superfamily II)